MTDRELLELAAKAVGIEGNYKEERRPEEGWEIIGIRTGSWTAWNPLTNDGDALRLAVKLDLFYHAAFISEFHDARCDVDATRRAIVRAAAAIGEQMK